MALTLEQIRKGIDYWRSKDSSQVPVIQRGASSMGGATIHVLEKACDGNLNRKIVLKWLFPDVYEGVEVGRVSSSKLDNVAFYALFRFVGAAKNELTNAWIGRRDLEEECSAIWWEYQTKTGQMVMIPVQEDQPPEDNTGEAFAP